MAYLIRTLKGFYKQSFVLQIRFGIRSDEATEGRSGDEKDVDEPSLLALIGLSLCNPGGVNLFISFTQGALRDPGLWNRTPYGVKDS